MRTEEYEIWNSFSVCGGGAQEAKKRKNEVWSNFDSSILYKKY